MPLEAVFRTKCVLIVVFEDYLWFAIGVKRVDYYWSDGGQLFIPKKDVKQKKKLMEREII